MIQPLGELEHLDPRTVWLHEAHDFTPWLLENADALGKVLGIDLELTAAEHPVGGFALDLIGRDLTNNCVLMVENQLTGTDHGHLGQLLTYAAGTEAGTVVWLATNFREEHRQALDFLNDLALPGAPGPQGNRQAGGDVMQSETRVDVSHYSYRVTWSAEDGEFVATCLEFPSLSWLAPTQIEALQGLGALVGDVNAHMAEQGEKVPAPFSERTYSGTFNVRIGEGLHRELVVHAAEEGLSLNQYVVKKLASA